MTPVPRMSMLVAMGKCCKTAMSPEKKKKKLCKISWKFYEEQCHLGFLAERIVSGLVYDPENLPVMRVPLPTNVSMFGQCSKILMSPEKCRRKWW